jgi:murein DD-endopeptidase MepM/ murein hydrolase activator NlpD
MVADKKSDKKKISTKLRDKYRIVIYNSKTFEEAWSKNLSRINIISWVGTIAILLVSITILLIAFTPIREFIPGYPNGEMTRNINLNTLRVDSIEHELKIKEQYVNNLMNILKGDYTEDNVDSEIKDTLVNYDDINFTVSKEDSLLRIEVENEDRYSIALFNEVKHENNISNLHFFPPIHGVVTNKFNAANNHLATDIVAAENEVISTVLDGTVIMTAWTLNTGNIIQIQHDNNLVSVYKHNSQLLKKQGDKVKVGEAIAIIGNSGELTSGPHLHFELWHNGTPIDPEEYISF